MRTGRVRRRSALFLVLSLLVCAAGLSQAPDRSKPPAPGPPAKLDLPAIQKLALSNGIPVLFIERHRVPLVQVSVVVKAGAAADPRGKAGLANLTAEMLDRGAGGRSALELSDAVDHLGADLSAGAGWDQTLVGLNVPSPRLGEALPLLADVVRRPAFRPEELERVRAFTWRGPGAPPRVLALESARPVTGRILVSFAGVNDRDQAATLTRGELLAERALLPDPGPGLAYTFQIVGLKVVEEDGREIGVVADVLRTGAHPVWVVRGLREVLIPATPQVVRKVDLDAGRITVALPAGLEEL